MPKLQPQPNQRSALALLVCMGIAGGLFTYEAMLRIIYRDGLPIQVQGGTLDNPLERRAESSTSTQYGTFSYDKFGFRIGSGLAYDRSVLFIGDSFTEGFGVGDDETFARATEEALRQNGIKARSLNAGHSGFGAAHELKLLRDLLGQLRPDALVVESFPMNDFSDNVISGIYGMENDRLVEYPRPRVPMQAWIAKVIATSWLQNLYVARLLANSLSRTPYDSPAGFVLEAALLRETFKVAAERNIPVVVLVIPTKLLQKRLPEARLSPTQRGEVERYEQVLGLVQQSGLAWIDTGTIITDLEADAARTDGAHFSRDGNRLVGEAIAAQLKPLLTSAAAKRQ